MQHQTADISITEFAQGFLRSAIQRFPALQPRLEMALYALPDEEELRRYCASVILGQFGQLLFHDLNIFDSASGGNSVFLPGVDFRWFFEAIDDSDTAAKEAIWDAIRRLTVMVSLSTDPNDYRFKDLQNDFLQTMDPEEVSERIQAFLQTMGPEFADASSAMDDDEEFTDGPRRRSATHQHCFDWANKLSSMKMGALLSEVIDRVRTQFPDIYEGMMQMQQEIDAQGPRYVSPKEQMQLFQKFMKDHSDRWGDIMKMMHDMLQDKIRRGEVKEEELRRETMQILQKLSKMDKADRKDYLEQAIRAGKAKPNAKINMTVINNRLAAETMKEKLRQKLKERKDASADLAYCTSDENVSIWNNINAGKDDALDALVQSIEQKTSNVQRKTKPKKR